jgi:uncharacterized protein (TIGR02646 family)
VELTEWIRSKTVDEGRHLENVQWDELTAEVKRAVQNTLARTQGFLCAYCGGRMEPERGTMRIEHWSAQNERPDLRFEWTNLLGVCPGTDGRESHCDRRRGEIKDPEDQVLAVKPDRDDILGIFDYEPHARGGLGISAKRRDAHHDVDVTLNLNSERLRANRQAALERVRSFVRREFPDKTLSRKFLRRLVEPSSDGRLESYLPAVLPTVHRWAAKAR